MPPVDASVTELRDAWSQRPKRAATTVGCRASVLKAML